MSLAAAPISETCGLGGDARGGPTSLLVLQDSVCRLKRDHPVSPRIEEMANGVLDVISSINEDSERRELWKSDWELKRALKRLTGSLVEQPLPQGESESSRNPALAAAINSFSRKWGDPKDRSNPARSQEYIADMEQILSLTETGRKTLECYRKAALDPRISASEVIDIRSLDKSDAAMAFAWVGDKANPGKFKQVIYIDFTLDPMFAIASWAHEKQHGCCKECFDHEVKFNRARSAGLSTEQEAAFFRQSSRYNVVDELRAYKVTTNVFAEIAEASPDLVCSRMTMSKLISRDYDELRSFGEVYAKMESMFKDGSFPAYFTRAYTDAGFYWAEDVYTPGGALDPALVASMREAGFNVAD